MTDSPQRTALDRAQAALAEWLAPGGRTEDDYEHLRGVAVGASLVSIAESLASLTAPATAEEIAEERAARRCLPEIAMLLQQLNYPLLHVADDGSVSKVADTTRARFTTDGRPRTNVAARGELETVHAALTGYEDVHGDDWPCLHPALAYVDEATATLGEQPAAPAAGRPLTLSEVVAAARPYVDLLVQAGDAETVTEGYRKIGRALAEYDEPWTP